MVEDETELNIESGDSDEEIMEKQPMEKAVNQEGVEQERESTEEHADQDDADQDDHVEKDTPDSPTEEVEFPDVAVKLRHLTTESQEEETTILQLSPKRPSRIKSDQPSQNEIVQKHKSNAGEMKRGQKQKLKKIKEKYKDQDEEERQLRMQVLGSAGGAEKEKKGNKKKGKGPSVASAPQKGKQQKAKASSGTKENIFLQSEEVKSEIEGGQSSKIESSEATGEAHQDDIEQEDQSQWTVEIVGAQEALTGCPLEDDVLLFAVPTCAPYSALSSFKYKVKLTPGTGKKGKATKTALTVFLKDRSANQREKELLRALQDQDMARNLPGKVKVSAPQLTAAKKQK